MGPLWRLPGPRRLLKLPLHLLTLLVRRLRARVLLLRWTRLLSWYLPKFFPVTVLAFSRLLKGVGAVLFVYRPLFHPLRLLVRGGEGMDKGRGP